MKQQMTKKQKSRRFTVVDYQGEPISWHRSQDAAERAIAKHEEWDKGFNEQKCIDYKIRAPHND